MAHHHAGVYGKNRPGRISPTVNLTRTSRYQKYFRQDNRMDCRISAKLRDAGFWLLVSGCWSLDAGLWMLDEERKSFPTWISRNQKYFRQDNRMNRIFKLDILMYYQNKSVNNMHQDLIYCIGISKICQKIIFSTADFTDCTDFFCEI